MRISDALSEVIRLGIDTSPFIYLVERHPKYFTLMQTILDYLTNNTYVAISSTLTLTEVLTLPIKLNKPVLVIEYEAILLNSTGFQLISLDSKIAKIAADIRARYNLKTPDAIQIATAIAYGCQAFLTNDRGLRRIAELRVLVLDDLELDPTPTEKMMP